MLPKSIHVLIILVLSCFIVKSFPLYEINPEIDTFEDVKRHGKLDSYSESEISEYMKLLIEKSKIHAQICNWVESFKRWRKETFEKWIDHYNNYLEISPNMFQMSKPRTCLQQIRHPCRFKSNKVEDRFGCPYLYCEINYKENYVDLMLYYRDDNFYFENYLHNQWDKSWNLRIEEEKRQKKLNKKKNKNSNRLTFDANRDNLL